MSESMNGNSRIDGWKGIADYLGRDVTTVIRWAKLHGLPVNRSQPGHPRRGVFALRHELDAWMAGHQNGDAAASSDADQNGAPSSTLSADLAHNLPQLIEEESQEEDRSKRAPSQTELVIRTRLHRRTVGILAAVVTFLLLSLAGGEWLHTRSANATPKFSSPTQLTFNGVAKAGLLTDGKKLYFGETQHGWLALASMPVDDGPIKILWHPNFNVIPVGYSPSAKALLLTGYEDIEYEQQLWIYPLGSRKPYRVGKILAHSAAWSPDGKKIAYANGKALYLVDANGTGKRELASYSGLPNMLHWSHDGRQLHFVLQNPVTGRASMYELSSSDGMRTFSVHSVRWPLRFNLYYDWSPTAKPGTFLFGGIGSLHDYSIYLVHYRTHWWESPIRQKVVPVPISDIGNLAMLPSDPKLFVLSDKLDQHGVMQYDPRTKLTGYILNNESVGSIDASRDGRWFVWIGLDEHGLTIARTDGSQKMHFPSLERFSNIELPRWSPDGKRVAFMAKKSHPPWRVYVLRVSDGSVREASTGDTNQGAPTWSPDGKYLVYGGVKCLGTKTCAIHRINLATGKVKTLPGSSGLVTARWSPNGKYIVAMQPIRHQLMLFDVATKKWRLLANGITGADLSWSSDSQHIYADILGANARIVRVDVTNGAETTVFDLNRTSRFNLTTAQGAVFCLGPHDTLIFPWPSPNTEIYSLKVSGL